MWTAAVLVLAVLGVLLLIWLGQRTMIYFPDRHVPSPAVTGLSDVEAVQIPVSGWRDPPGVVSPEPCAATVANGDRVQRQRRQQGLSESTRRRRCGARVSPCCSSTIAGSATAAGVRPSAVSTTMRVPFARYLAGRSDVRADRLVYFGESLGTAVAVRLAVEHPPAALILRSPFTSMVDVGRLHYPILPVRWLLRDRFSSIDAIESVRSPVLIVAGDRDRIVPLEQSRRLFERAPEPRELVVVRGADHNDAALLDGRELIDAVRRFIEAHAVVRGGGA